MEFKPETTHADLGPDFYDEVAPAHFPAAILRFRNQRWAAHVGLDSLDETQWLNHFAHFSSLPGSFRNPLALRYHGHQFRSYNPDLGDGRGFLFAQLRDDRGRLLDLGTKGSGRTPWSRQGDGRLTLKGGVREVLATQMLEALGVNTSKSFSLVETGEALMRGDEPSPTRSSVLVRLSHSHIRIGTFQRLAFLGQRAALEHLLDHCLIHYYDRKPNGPLAERIGEFLRLVAHQLARTTAQWMAAGFVHGVLNSDNTNITGESFDYGPWRFLPTYQPGFTAAYFDETGLYAFARQPSAIGWNLLRLAECFVDLAPIPVLEAALDHYSEALQPNFARAILRRLGLEPQDFVTDLRLANAWFQALHESQVPFEPAFFDWFGNDSARALQGPRALHYGDAAFAECRALLASYQPRRGIDLANAYWNGAPCTMTIEDVEALWAPIAQLDDWSAFHAKLDAVEAMAQAYNLTAD